MMVVALRPKEIKESRMQAWRRNSIQPEEQLHPGAYSRMIDARQQQRNTVTYGHKTRVTDHE